MSKDQVIAAIRDLNRSATNEFLIEFNVGALTRYLEHLKYKAGPRGAAPWRRPADTPAIVTRSH